MRPRDAITPASLVVLAAGTAAYAYLVDRRTISDADRAARKGEVFPSFRVDQVARVELDQAGTSLVLERDANAGAGSGGGSGWLITSPRTERADAAQVDTLLRELELARRVRQVPDGEAVGLDVPRVRGRMTVGALEYRFELGADAPRPEGAAYMQLDGDRAFVVGRTLKVQLLRGADAYRDRVLVPFGASDTARMDVKQSGGDAGAGGGFAIERHGTTFRVVGSGLRASRAVVEQLFAALGDTRAETFLDDAQADRAMAGLWWTVTLSPRSSERAPIELRVGGRCPVQPEGIVVERVIPSRGPTSRVSACAPKTILLALEAAPASLADVSPLYARADEIEDLRLEAMPPLSRRVDLARKDRGWHEREPEERELDADESESANALAAALAGARATEARPALVGAADERFAARARATAVRTGGGVTEVVEIGQAEPDGSSLMRRGDDGAVLRVPRAAARRFWPQAVALRARSIWAAAAGHPAAGRVPFPAASVVAVDDSCGAPAQRLELHDGLWMARRPRGSHASAAAVTDFLEALASAKAQAWIADADDGTFGFGGDGACEVAVTFGATSGADAGSGEASGSGADGGSRADAWTRAGVVFGAAGDGGVYARLLDDKAVFVAPASLRESASRACSTHADAGLP